MATHLNRVAIEISHMSHMSAYPSSQGTDFGQEAKNSYVNHNRWLYHGSFSSQLYHEMRKNCRDMSTITDITQPCS